MNNLIVIVHENRMSVVKTKMNPCVSVICIGVVQGMRLIVIIEIWSKRDIMMVNNSCMIASMMQQRIDGTFSYQNSPLVKRETSFQMAVDLMKRNMSFCYLFITSDVLL